MDITPPNDQFGRPDWDSWFMALAFVVAQRSIDPSTKHGAILVDRNRRIIGVGYNGRCRGIDDSQLPLTRPEKYQWMIHAEVNCVLNTHAPIDSDCVLYITGHPCVPCLNTTAQAGIKKIIWGPRNSHCVPQSEIDSINKFVPLAKIDLVKYEGDYRSVLADVLAP